MTRVLGIFFCLILLFIPPKQNNKNKMPTQTFTFNGGFVQTYTVTTPGTLTIVASGAQGGNGNGTSMGGLGGQITGTYTITSTSSLPQTFNIVVGGQGGNGSGAIGGAGGVGAIPGGMGGSSPQGGNSGGGGGAASTIQFGSFYIMIAGGGGGGEAMVQALQEGQGEECREEMELLRHHLQVGRAEEAGKIRSVEKAGQPGLEQRALPLERMARLQAEEQVGLEGF